MQRILNLPIVALTAISVNVPFPPAALAQAPVGALVTMVIPAGEFGSKQFTDVLVTSLGAAKGFCSQLDQSYQIDCIAERLDKMASDIPKDSDYEEVKALLKSTSDEMSDVARRNRDRTRPRQKASSGGSNPQTTTRPLTPVAQASLIEASLQAAAILDRTETLLLRSPDDDSGKSLHYARIAEALGSNKTLLRS